jgi:hypothetical protein
MVNIYPSIAMDLKATPKQALPILMASDGFFMQFLPVFVLKTSLHCSMQLPVKGT